MPSVDVVIPCYQYGRYLRECVSSVFNQQIDQVRILIVDNASTDDSVQVANELAAKDDRIEVRVHSANLGFHASVNEGLDWAAGDYVMVLCADDLLPPGTLMRAVSIMESHPNIAFAYGAYALMKGPENLLVRQGEPATRDDGPHEFWNVLSGRDFIAQCCRQMVYLMAPLVRTSLQKKVGHYRKELEYTSDLEVLLRLACMGDVAATPAVQGIQRIHGANISMATWDNPAVETDIALGIFDSFFQREGKNLPHSAQAHRYARRNIANQTYWRGVARILRGHPRAGLELMKVAIRLAPRIAIVPPLGHLWRTDRPAHRIAQWVSSTWGGRGRQAVAGNGPDNGAHLEQRGA